MRDDLLDSLLRYEAMAGLSDWTNEANPTQRETDRAAYENHYGATLFPDGHEQHSYARMLRFLVEVCGHAYEDALAAIVEHYRAMPGAYRADADPEADARHIRAGSGNIIEALFDLKVGRLICEGDDMALAYNWRTARSLMALSADSNPTQRKGE